MKTIAIDFDGVIHKYSKGWHDGTCYDDPMDGVEEFLNELMTNKYISVFVFSTRSSRQIKKWIIDKMPSIFGPMAVDCGQMWTGQEGFGVEIIPFWVKFWNKNNVLGITKKKLPAIAYIDDRAIKFEGNFDDIRNKLN